MLVRPTCTVPRPTYSEMSNQLKKINKNCATHVKILLFGQKKCLVEICCQIDIFFTSVCHLQKLTACKWLFAIVKTYLAMVVYSINVYMPLCRRLVLLSGLLF